MQEMKRFVQGADPRVPSFAIENIEDQINAFLKENPNYIIRSFDIVLGPRCKEAFVLFDIREEKKPKPEIGFNKDITRNKGGKPDGKQHDEH